MASNGRGLKNDERGAIMVAAVFMAAFLVGSLWYVAGVGNAALFRESMQNGADASAFAGAVMHARGMNIIALINLIMAAVLAVLVALKIAYVLLQITAIICAALCPWTAVTCAIAGYAENGAMAVDKLIKVVEPIVDKTLMALSFLQKGVAKVIPFVAVYDSYKIAKKYDKPVGGALMISDALIPTDGFGLPVVEDKYSVLCERAVDQLSGLVSKIFGPLIPTKWVSALLNTMVKTAPSYFCGGSDSGGGGGGSGQNNDQIAKQICDSQKEAADKAKKDAKDKGSKDKPKDPPTYEECLKKNKQDLSKTKQSGNSSTKSNSSKKTPKKVDPKAQNGNRYLQVISYAWGDMTLASSSRTGVKIAAWGKSTFEMPDLWGKIQFADAEYYCAHSTEGSTSWDAIKDDCMWNMEWTARLRRYHGDNAPGGTLVEVPMKLLTGVPQNALKAVELLQNASLGNLLGGLTGGQDSLVDVYTQQGKKTTGGEFEKIDTSKALESAH